MARPSIERHPRPHACVYGDMDDFRLLIRRTGGPDAVEREPIDPPAPAPGEVLVRHQAVGVNFIDTYQRGGLYPIQLPSGLGSEGTGVIEALGEGVTGFTIGQRVGYAGGPLGAYSTVRALPAEWLVRLPDAISAETAAAVLLKGQTVDMLVGPCAQIAAGQAVLVHAASGGVGSLLVPWLRSVGATVIAHAGTDAKADRAKQLGATHSLSCPMDELAAHVRELTDGRGAEVVLDGVGQASWDASLASTAKRGLIVSYGNASGAVPPVPPLALTRAGSLFLTRPTLFDYLDSPETRQASADRVFAKIADGTLPVEIGRTFPLAEAGEAHRALEARQTIGSTVLTI